MCYTIPLGAAIITTALWKKSRKKSSKLWTLNLMLYGGALFGIVDHLYNGELFVIGESLRKDLFLGVLITASILAFWGIILALAKKNPALTPYPKKGT